MRVSALLGLLLFASGCRHASSRAFEADVTTLAQPAGPPEAGAPVDLLHSVPTAIIVSSTTTDDGARPEFLADGLLYTEWRSANRDEIGAYVELRVPPGSQVTGVRMTVGHTTPGGEAFDAAPRIRRVQVFADGHPIGEFDLDPALGTRQLVPVTGRGSTWRIVVTAVEGGTDPLFERVTISDLELWGFPPSGLDASGGLTPTVSVASRDSTSLDAGASGDGFRPVIRGPLAAFERLCEQANSADAGDAGGCVGALSDCRLCAPDVMRLEGRTGVAHPAAPLMAVRFFTTTGASGRTPVADMAIRTPRGWFSVDLDLPEDEGLGPYWGQTRILALGSAAEGSAAATVRVRYEVHQRYPTGDGPSGEGAAEDTNVTNLTCRWDATAGLSCVGALEGPDAAL